MFSSKSPLSRSNRSLPTQLSDLLLLFPAFSLLRYLLPIPSSMAKRKPKAPSRTCSRTTAWRIRAKKEHVTHGARTEAVGKAVLKAVLECAQVPRPPPSRGQKPPVRRHQWVTYPEVKDHLELHWGRGTASWKRLPRGNLGIPSRRTYVRILRDLQDQKPPKLKKGELKKPVSKSTPNQQSKGFPYGRQKRW